MTAPTIRVHRDGFVTADGDAIGIVAQSDPNSWAWIALSHGREVARTRTRREAVAALLDHTYPKERHP